ncbi:MAG: 16S rRNA (uracil(1498)-N(3))-methyltransferase [Verrucomicrobiales bacterium]
MDRFWLPASAWSVSPALSGEEAHHCARVMRKGRDDEIEVFDGEGRVARARLGEVGKQRVELEWLGEARLVTPLRPRITLAVGIPKGKTMDLIIQKAVELGVARIVPLLSEQGVVKVEDGGRKREKWQRVAFEACKQCGQNFLPEVAEPQRVGDFLQSWQAGGGLGLVGALRDEARALGKVLREADLTGEVGLLVGPEGDFSAAEYETAFAAGFQPVDLGDLVLRVETAALMMVSALRCEAGARAGD